MLLRNQIYSILLILLVVAACKRSEPAVKVEKRPLTMAVYASGRIYPYMYYKVTSKIPGYIQKFNVALGDSVNIGDPLVTIRNEVNEMNIGTTKNLLDMARENASENSPMQTSLRQEYLSALAKYQLDSANYARVKKLVEQQASTVTASDQARTAAEVSRQTYIRALNNYKTAKERLRVELLNAELQYQAQVQNKNDFMILSTIKGRVFNINQKPGELTAPQIPLVELGDPTLFEVELAVDETDIGFIKKGLKVYYNLDAYKDKVFEGFITEIYPVINSTNKTAKVVASIKTGEDVMYAGMSAEANIIIMEKEGALVVPREYITPGNMVKPTDSDSMIKIERGIEDLEYVEVVSGLKEGQELSKP